MKMIIAYIQPFMLDKVADALRERRIHGMTVLAVASLILTISSCASNKINVLDSGTTALQLLSSESAYLEHVRMEQINGELAVSGHVRRLLFSIFSNPHYSKSNRVTILQYEKSPLVVGGHVDIAIVAPDGSVLNKVSVPYHPHKINVISSRPSSFGVRIAIIPPDGSIVRVAHHNVSYSAEGPFDCGSNAALPNAEADRRVSQIS